MKSVHVGTSGWLYRHWKGRFYPPTVPTAEWFNHYQLHFDSVELNNSFYRLPTFDTFRAWREQTPRNFVFTVKASRFITHAKKLLDPVESSELFFENLGGLDPKVGAVLFQLPPHWKANAERLDAFLAAMPGSYRYAVEFREPSWYASEILRILERRKAALCISHIAGALAPLEVTADFVYVRLHGPTDEKYRGSYNRKALEQWAERIGAWRRGHEVFCYFDNDEAGYAALNAAELRSLLGLGRGGLAATRGKGAHVR